MEFKSYDFNLYRGNAELFLNYEDDYDYISIDTSFDARDAYLKDDRTWDELTGDERRSIVKDFTADALGDYVRRIPEDKLEEITIHIGIALDW